MSGDSLQQPTVVIIADDAEFPRLVSGRWQSERRIPGFTVLSSDLCAACEYDPLQLVVVGPVKPESILRVLGTLTAAGHALIFITEDHLVAEKAQSEFPRLLVLRRQEGWLDPLVLLSGEVLRRLEAQSRAVRAEAVHATLKRNAVLGQYVLEMRHSLNNALTSMLGNSELLLLEPGAMGANERAQVATIRNMGLRVHEILQRFSSLEKELTMAETQPQLQWQSERRSNAVQ